MRLKNITNGPKGINLANGGVAYLDAGQTSEDFTVGKDGDVTEAELKNAMRDGYFEEVGGKAAKAKKEATPAGGKKAEGGDDGKLPSLSGKNKAELTEIAAAEGVDHPEDATMDDIREAIEAKRASGA